MVKLSLNTSCSFCALNFDNCISYKKQITEVSTLYKTGNNYTYLHFT